MGELNVNIFNVLIISGVVYGFIFSTIVLTTKKYITNNTSYLAFTVLFLSLSNLQYWFLDIKLDSSYPLLRLFYIPWHWLVLPMFFIYVSKFLLHKQTKKKHQILVTVPFFIVLLIYVVYALNHLSDSKSDSHFEKGFYSYLEFASILFNFVVLYLSFKVVKTFEATIGEDITKIKPPTLWLKKLIYTGIVICSCWLLGICLIVFLNVNQSYVFYPMWLGISILVYWIGHVGISKSLQLKELVQLRSKRFYVQNEKPNLVNKSFSQLEHIVTERQLFLIPNLTLKTLAKELHLSEGYISQLINNNTSFNFNDYINKLRVEEIKTHLTDPEFDNYTLESIGLEGGFSSKSSFYSAFKKFTGQTPAAYKKEVRNL